MSAMLKSAKTIGTGALVAVVVALTTFGLTARVVDLGSTPKLIAGTDFAITSAVTPYPACSGSPAQLFPGITRCITYTVTNPLPDAITVDSINLAVAAPVPAGCAASNLDVTQANFSGSVVIPANGSGTIHRQLTLKNTAANQNGCKAVTFNFAYTGSATYVHTYSTSTALASSANPSLVGQQVTFTATVTTPSQTPPSAPTGSVTFKDGAAAIACESGSTAFNGSTATCKYTVGSSGTHAIQASYISNDLQNFTSSDSATVNQGVNLRPTGSVVASSLNPANYGQNVSFTVTVTSPSGGTPAGSVTFFDGATAKSTTNLDGTGKATYVVNNLLVGTHPIKAVYAGNATFATSTSNTVNQVINYSAPCITGNQNSNLTVASGQAICIAGAGKVNGTATIQSGGILYVNGGTVNNNVTVNAGGGFFVTAGSTINGSVTATSATYINLCGAKKINGNVSVSGSPNIVLIGDGTASCAGNDINGSVTLTNNTAGYKVIGNNINGNVTATNNAGSGVIGKNDKLNGNLACSGNSPAPTNGGQPNSVKGTRSGQCSAANF